MQALHAVGCYLEHETKTRPEGERDAFARSTFNRFYYAAFLEVRDLLKRIDYDAWDTVGHKAYPDVLQSIQKNFRAEATRARKASDTETSRSISKASDALRTISEIMAAAYISRVTADYNIEIPVKFGEGDVFYINSVSVKDAKSWYRSISKLVPVIRQAWMQISK